MPTQQLIEFEDAGYLNVANLTRPRCRTSEQW